MEKTVENDLLTEEELADLFLSSVPQGDFEKQDEFKTRKIKRKKRYTQDDLFDEQVAEQKQRRRFRCLMFWLFFGLLLIQHYLLFKFVQYAIISEKIVDIQPLLSIIIPATLGETYAIIKIMVTFIFSPGNFENKTK